MLHLDIQNIYDAEQIFYNKKSYDISPSKVEELTIEFSEELLQRDPHTLHLPYNFNTFVYRYYANFQILPFKNIKKLNINLICCQGMTDYTFKRILEKINSKKVEEFSVNFFNCDKISDESLQFIKNKFIKNNNLSKIIIHAGDCNSITNEGLNQINQLVSAKISDLKVFKFNGSWNLNISDDSIKSLSKNLQNNKCLQEIDLNFENCPQLSKKALKYVVDIAKSVNKEHIREFHFQFINQKRISENNFQKSQEKVIKKIAKL